MRTIRGIVVYHYIREAKRLLFKYISTYAVSKKVDLYYIRYCSNIYAVSKKVDLYYIRTELPGQFDSKMC